MAVVAGVVFFAVRALLALIPRRLSDQEMVGRRGPCRRCLLSSVVRRRGRHATLVFHDGGGADRRHGRSLRRHFPHARGGGDDRAGARAGSAGASELPELGDTSKPNGILFGTLANKGILTARSFGLGARKPNRKRQKPALDGQKSRNKSRTFAWCSRRIPATDGGGMARPNNYAKAVFTRSP
jgi:hypothetical protein